MVYASQDRRSRNCLTYQFVGLEAVPDICVSVLVVVMNKFVFAVLSTGSEFILQLICSVLGSDVSEIGVFAHVTAFCTHSIRHRRLKLYARATSCHSPFTFS